MTSIEQASSMKCFSMINLPMESASEFQGLKVLHRMTCRAFVLEVALIPGPI